MALKIVLLALLVCCAASEAQSQGDDTSLPLSYNATELQGDGATCPNDQLRQETRDNITNGIRSQVQTSVYSSVLIAEGFSRIAYLDMTDPNQQCPPNWQEISTSGVRSCARNTADSCDSVTYPNTGGNSYSQVCGRAIGYLFCSPDAFGPPHSNDIIDSAYLDGVSVTHGSSPRQHVWSFAAGIDENDSAIGCPCIANPNMANSGVPSFVGNDYFCDTVYAVNPFPNCDPVPTIFPVTHPLWDGGGCGPTGGCCENNNPPWFCKTLPQPTTDDIEVRICADEALANEDVTVEMIEIYVN